jgi:hypothetical protein
MESNLTTHSTKLEAKAQDFCTVPAFYTDYTKATDILNWFQLFLKTRKMLWLNVNKYDWKSQSFLLLPTITVQ